MIGVNRGATFRAVVLAALLLGALLPPIGSRFLVAPGAVLASGLMLWDLLHTRRLPVGSWFIIGLFGLLALPLLWHTWGSLEPYGQDKVLRLFSLTLFTAAASTIVRDRVDVTYLARGLLLFGFVLAIITIVGPVDHLGRSVGIPGTNPLWLARAIGLGLVSALWLALNRQWHWAPTALMSGVLALGLYLTGSRGPTFGTALGLLIVASAAVTVQMLRVHRKIVAALGIVGTIALIAVVIVSQRYIVVLTNPTSDASTASRIDYWSATLDLISANPWGVGYGAWQRATELPASYPHNVILEVAAELGWLVGVVFVAAIVAVVGRLARRCRRDAVSNLVLGLFAVEMASLMLSGNINARTWFFLLALGWIVTAWPSSRRDGGSNLAVGIRRGTDSARKA